MYNKEHAKKCMVLLLCSSGVLIYGAGSGMKIAYKNSNFLPLVNEYSYLDAPFSDCSQEFAENPAKIQGDG